MHVHVPAQSVDDLRRGGTAGRVDRQVFVGVIVHDDEVLECWPLAYESTTKTWAQT